MPDWLPPLLAAVLAILVLNVALLEQRRRAHRGSWDEQLLRELRAWDGRLPEEFNRPVAATSLTTRGQPLEG